MDKENKNNIDELVDSAQEIISLLTSVFSKKVQGVVNVFNIEIDVEQLIEKNKGIPEWKIKVSTRAGGVVAVVTGTVLGVMVTQVSTIALRAAGPLPAGAIFVNGTLITLDAAEQAGTITRDAILRALTSDSPDQFEGKEIPVPVEKPESVGKSSFLDGKISQLNHEDREEIKTLFKQLYMKEFDQVLRDLRFFN